MFKNGRATKMHIGMILMIANPRDKSHGWDKATRLKTGFNENYEREKV